MTATNHALTGAAIGLLVSTPIIAVPLAFGSHFVLDSIPHFGVKGSGRENLWLKGRAMKLILIAEAGICFAIVCMLAVLQPAGWQLAAVCAFVATTPDLYSLPRFLVANGWSDKPVHWNTFRRFHQAIQTERIWGIWIEAVWFACIAWLFIGLLRV